MGVFKRKYKTKDGEVAEGQNWSCEFYIDTQRYSKTMPGTSSLSKKSAEKLCDELKGQKENELRGVAGAKFEDAALAYYEGYIENVNQRRASTHKRVHDRYCYIVPLLVERFQGKALSSLARKDFIELVQELRRKGLKDSTIESNHLRFVSAMYNHAEMIGLCDLRDIPNFRTIKRMLKKSKQKTRYLTEKEFSEIYNFCIESSDRERRRTGRVIGFAVETGLRKEELFSLRRQHINLAEKFARIVDIKDKKNSRDRYVPLTDFAIQQLQQQQQDYSGIKSEYAFFNDVGERIIDSDTSFNRIMQILGIEDVTFHDLRRTYGSWKLQGIRGEKLGIKKVSVRLGHKSVKQTEEAYAFLEEQGIKIEE